jgi:hypothetical protein
MYRGIKLKFEHIWELNRTSLYPRLKDKGNSRLNQIIITRICIKIKSGT